MNLSLRKIPFSPPDLTEEEISLVTEVLRSGWITTGPRTKEFERQIAAYCGTAQTVCLNSATAALEIALRLLDLGPEDEVIVPAYTYTATASVTQHLGCRLVLVDSQPDCVEMDYERLAAAITTRTKAVIPVDLAGIVCDYERIFAVIEAKRDLFRPANAIQAALGRIAVVADAAHAFGASRNGRMAGSLADFSAFSFHAVKNLTTAEGGALTWRLPFGEDPAVADPSSPVQPLPGECWDAYLYRLSQLYSLHGQNRDALAKTRAGSWEYDILGTWYKCNMTDIAAALGLAQLQRFPQFLARRREIIGRYNEALKGLDFAVLNHFDADHQSSGHLYPVRLLGRSRDETNAVMSAMAERGIATNVHYKPLPLMTAYKALGFDIGDYPQAFRLYENELTLPLHTRLSDEDVAYVIHHFTDILSNLPR